MSMIVFYFPSRRRHTSCSLVTGVQPGALPIYAVHALVFRPLRHEPPLAKTVASVGFILVLQAAISLRFGSDSRSAAPILPDDPVRILDGIVKADRLWLGAIAIVLAAALWALFRFTVYGLAARAAAGNEKGAVLLGYSTDRLAAIDRKSTRLNSSH